MLAHHQRRFVFGAIVFACMPVPPTIAAPKPVPASPYLGVAYRFADALLRQGRGEQRPDKAPLFYSALDRVSPGPLNDRPAAPRGVPDDIRAAAAMGPLTGAAPAHDQNLFRLLYLLGDLSNKPAYRKAADAQLDWLLRQSAATNAEVAPWDSGAVWDPTTGSILRTHESDSRGPMRPWLLWDRAFELAPEESTRLTLGMRRLLEDPKAKPRAQAFALRAFSAGYAATKDEAYLQAIERGVSNLQSLLESSNPAATTGFTDGANAAEWLSAAIDCDGAARRVPQPLATRLQRAAEAIDAKFCALAHDVDKQHGFVLLSRGSGPSNDAPKPARSSLWQASIDVPSTAQIGMMCVSRYENSGQVAYRTLVHAAADAYRGALPAAELDVWPLTFGQAISLQLAAWRSTANEAYLQRARELADAAVLTFWADDALPKASTRSAHYESVTGGDTLALTLVELHLNILGITAVRSPPNTIDR